MVRTLALILTLVGMGGLILGVLGIFGTPIVNSLSPWALAILGLIFFIAGVSMFKYGKKAA